MAARRRTRSSLDRMLAEGPRAAPTAMDALHLAKQQFLAGQRLDMGQLAEELGINRVTLYRWVGSRERLQVEVLWYVTHKMITRAASEIRAKGGKRIALILSRFTRTLLGSDAMAAWMQHEGEAGMRLMTTREADFLPRVVNLVKGLLDEEAAAGRLKLPIASGEFALLLTRIAESYVYRRFITGDASDGDSAEALFLHVLR